MKTALIFTGGTIGSGICGDYISVNSKKKMELLTGFDTSEFDIFEPYTILSENLDMERLTALLKCIEKNLDGHDGIIILHGTDTLQYSAAASAYAFGLNTIPIVFVSSNYILSDSRANGRINFRIALDFIKCGVGRGTFIAYCNTGEKPKIHRATRVTAHAQYSDDITSIGGEYCVYRDGRFVKNPEYSEEPDAAAPFGVPELKRGAAARIAAYPGMTIDSTADAVLVETYHSGTISESVISETNIRIFVLGTENRMQYESAKAYRRENITLLRKAAAPAMYIKLIMAVCTGRLDNMNASLCGDFVE